MGINSFRVVNSITYAEAKSYQTLGVIVLGAAQPLSATDLYATQVELYGYKTVGGTAPVNNTGNVLTGSNGVMTDTVTPGAKVTLTAPLGGKINLKEIFVSGTGPDGVYVRYLQ
jgi:hypothetical protein